MTSVIYLITTAGTFLEKGLHLLRRTAGHKNFSLREISSLIQEMHNLNTRTNSTQINEVNLKKDKVFHTLGSLFLTDDSVFTVKIDSICC